MAKHPSFSSLFNLQSHSINFKFGHFWAKYQGYSLTFWPNNLQSKSINFKFGHLWAKYQGYSLTFWPNIPHFHHFSICNHTQSISNLVIFEQNTKAIALLFGQTICNQNQSISNLVIFEQNTKAIAFFLAKHPSFSSLFNLQSHSINFKFGHFWAKYQGYSLTFWPNNLQSKSINFKFGHFWAKYQGYSLTFWPNIAHFHHFSIRNQTKSISNLVIFEQNTKAIALLFGQTICNQNQSISNLVIFEQNTKAIALLFGETSLIFITFQSAIKINQFQIWSFVSKIPRL